jgi:ABC-type Fe3+ transport system substrate-binding protein
LNAIMLAAQSRHPNATKLFIDFVLSKKGQEMIRSFHRVPARTGVDAEPPRIFKGYKRVVQDIEPRRTPTQTRSSTTRSLISANDSPAKQLLPTCNLRARIISEAI